MYKNSRLRTPKECPVCGEDVPSGSLACPECGADHRSGWKEDSQGADGLSLPDNEFDYDEFVKEEFGSGSKSSGLRPVWWITAIILLIAFAAWIVLSIV